VFRTSVFVGNLSPGATEDDLIQAFGRFGTVAKVNIVKDRETGRPRGFAFVDMTGGKAAATAIQELNLAEIDGRSITEHETRPKTDRPRRGDWHGR